jgi:regulator of protease activity HflC (stomatin/prohibitin superfamily)
MAASSPTVDEVSAPEWPGKVLRGLFIAGVFLIAFFIYKAFFKPTDLDDIRWWIYLLIWFFLATLVYIVLMMDKDRRLFALVLLSISLLTILVAGFVQRELVTNRSIIQAVRESAVLNFIFGGYTESVVWSSLLGLVVGLLVVVLPLLILGYIASAYLLALHEDDGVRRRDAVRYVLSPLLSTNLPFIVVENGQALTTKDSGKITFMGGPGKLIVKQGNVVVLERAGKITRIVNAGVTKLRPRERIRNVFTLGRKSKSVDVEYVLTRDRVPLKINLGVAVRIEPAAEVEKRPESRVAPDGEALTKKLDDGLYRVYKGTICKAALMSQATAFAKRKIETCTEDRCVDVVETPWQDVVGSPPVSQLRDQIMAHRFDELFELVESAPGEKPEVRVKKLKIAAIENALLEDLKPKRIPLGVQVLGVDIGKIEFPEEAEDLLLSRWGAPWNQEVHLIEAEGKAQSALRTRVSEAQGKLEATRMEARGELEIADWKAETILKRARAEAQRQFMEGRSKAQAQATFFTFIAEALQVDGGPRDPQLTRSVLEQLARTFASVNDLETYVRVFGKMNQQPTFPPMNGGAEAGE